MKKIILCVIIVSALAVAGCTTISSGNIPTTPGVPSPTSIPVRATVAGSMEGVLPMNAEVALGTGNKTFNVSINSIEIDPPDDAGKHTVNIYIGAKNTGTEPRNLTWFSRFTDINGKTYGGIGVSHAGSGARTRNIPVNVTEWARDYIVINSDKDMATLSERAVLDVYFLEPRPAGSPLVPDYRVTWMINPGVIK